MKSWRALFLLLALVASFLSLVADQLMGACVFGVIVLFLVVDLARTAPF